MEKPVMKITFEGKQGVGKSRFADKLKKLVAAGVFCELGDITILFEEKTTDVC